MPVSVEIGFVSPGKLDASASADSLPVSSADGVAGEGFDCSA
jgi:hypothetical protein